MHRRPQPMERPTSREYGPGYQKYMDLVPVGDYVELLRKNSADTVAFLEGIPSQKHGYRYAEGKWTIKEVLMHVIDNERVFAYRALAAARGDESPMHRMDEELYARSVDVADRPWSSLIAEFKAVRLATEFLFQNMTEEQSLRSCNIVAQPMTARAIGYFILGHVQHHVDIIRERYLR